MQQMLIDVEGRSFPEVLDEKVLSPLGMDHSTYYQPLDSEMIKMGCHRVSAQWRNDERETSYIP